MDETTFPNMETPASFISTITLPPSSREGLWRGHAQLSLAKTPTWTVRNTRRRCVIRASNDPDGPPSPTIPPSESVLDGAATPAASGPTGGGADSTPSPPGEKRQTKTEQIAAKLGQSRESMQASREKVMTEQRYSNRKKYSLTAAGFAIGILAFALERADPNNGVVLMNFMQQNSAPSTVIGNGRPTVVEFSASWCENCRKMAKGVFQLENQFVDRVNFVIVDTDDPKNADFVDAFGVDGIPQVSMMDAAGKNLANLIGYVPKPVLLEEIEALVEGKDMPYEGLSLKNLEELRVE